MKNNFLNMVIIVLGVVLGWSFHELPFKIACRLEYAFQKKPEPHIRIKDDILKVDVLKDGNIESYHKLKEKFCEDSLPHNIFYYALYMSDKYGYNDANYDAYRSIVDIYSNNPALGGIDSLSYSLAIEFLKKGASGGDIRAIRELERMGSFQIPQDH